MALRQVRSAGVDLFLICVVWSILIGTLLILQAVGLDFGFNIWPIGEFRNWIKFLQDGHGFSALKLFWAVDNRNALSPWWYLAARPLIFTVPAAPLILHLLVGLFVGIAAYLMLVELTRARSFALSVGILSALFLPNLYLDEVNWNFVGALGCTLISIWLFALFCNDRQKSGCLAASYLAWFVAISTYTIQIGAMGAIFMISLRERLTAVPLIRATAGALADAVPYFALLVVYVLLWITTSAPAVLPSAYHLEFSYQTLAKSALFGLWNEHYQIFWMWMVRAGPRLMAIVFGLATATILLLLYRLKPSDYPRSTMHSLGFAFLIGVCIATPTIGLETMSNIWTPGTRWPMLMQFWSPFLFCIIVFALTSAVPDRFWWSIWKAVTASSAAFVILLVLGFNHTQIVHVREERIFFTQLQAAVTQDRLSGLRFPRRYLIQLAGSAAFLPVVSLADSYAHTILGRDVTFRVVKTLPEQSDEATSLIWQDHRFSRPPGTTSVNTPTSQ
jgi:hypothetical protein